MLLIKTLVKSSAIHGLGCFTKEAVKKGEKVWEFHEGLDVKVPLEEMDGHHPVIQEFFKTYAYVESTDNRKYKILCGDNTRYMNHSSSPNVVDAPDGSSVAARDIAEGEELVCDYQSFDLGLDEELK